MYIYSEVSLVYTSLTQQQPMRKGKILTVKTFLIFCKAMAARGCDFSNESEKSPLKLFWEEFFILNGI